MLWRTGEVKKAIWWTRWGGEEKKIAGIGKERLKHQKVNVCMHAGVSAKLPATSVRAKKNEIKVER